MKRIRYYVGRLLCRIGRHKWSFFGFAMIPWPSMLKQCDRCGMGRAFSPFGHRDFPAEKMQEARTCAEVEQVAWEKQMAESGQPDFENNPDHYDDR